MGCRRSSSLAGSTLALLLATGLGPATAFAAPAADEAFDNRPNAAAMLADVLVVRPISLVGAVVTTTAFVVTLPLSALGGNAGEAASSLVSEPLRFTFTRPLGALE